MIFANKKWSQLSFRGQRRVSLFRSTFLLSFSLFVFVLAGMPMLVSEAHVYKDGFVERSLSITIRGETGRGELLIGLNKTTANSILAEAKLAKARSNGRPDTPSDSAPQKKTQAPAADAKDSAPAASQGGEPKCEPKGVVESSRKLSPPTSHQQPNQIGAASSATPDREDGEVAQTGEGQHLTDPEMIKQLASLKDYWALKKLNLTLGGRQVELKNVSVSPAPRHPYSMVLKFDFSLPQPDANLADDPAGDRVKLRLLDQTFPKQNGAVRYSLRSRGSTILLNSNVAPVIVRAERFEFKKTRDKINSTSFTIDATLIVDR